MVKNKTPYLLLALSLIAPLSLFAQSGTSSGTGPFEFKTEGLRSTSGIEKGNSATLAAIVGKEDQANNLIRDSASDALGAYCKGLTGKTLEGSLNQNAGECRTTDDKPGKLTTWKEFTGNIAQDIVKNQDRIKITVTGVQPASRRNPGSANFKAESPNDSQDTPYIMCQTEEKSRCDPVDESENEATMAAIELLFSALE